MSSILLINKFGRIGRMPFIQCQATQMYSSKTKDTAEIPTNPLKDFYNASKQKGNGKVADKKPSKILLEKDKKYKWCQCGHSRRQPFCDGSHMAFWKGITLRPIKFTVTETKEYLLCNCKQTANKPFCDGTHKKPEIQELIIPN